MRSEKEIQLLEQGPFPGRIDPWAEHEHVFHSLHEQMIGVMTDVLRKPLLQRGYVVGRETSLQVVESRIPDVFIRRDAPVFNPGQVSYDLAAEEVLADAGILIQELPPLTALAIYERDTHRLVTVIEVVSPANKDRDKAIQEYEQRRERLYLTQGINVVEVDITRSQKRLITHPLLEPFPYHAAVFLSGEGLRIIGMSLEQPLKRIALPLRGEVVPLDLHAIYDRAYQQLGLAALIQNETHYDIAHLPFPSLLTDDQQRDALAQARAWQAELARVQKDENSGS